MLDTLPSQVSILIAEGMSYRDKNELYDIVCDELFPKLKFLNRDDESTFVGNGVIDVCDCSCINSHAARSHRPRPIQNLVVALTLDLFYSQMQKKLSLKSKGISVRSLR